MKFSNLQQIETALEPYVAIAGRMTGKGMTVDRTLQLAHYAGSPQDDLKIIHVAGTSGKTSTCYFVADLLRRSGQKVGLTVSPHIDSITERVQINGEPLTEALFCDYFSEFMEHIEDAPEMPSYFELMMLFALWVFKKENVDYAVIETGLGGLHDSSNIVSRADKVCVLTDIGFDHMHVLGGSIEEIAAQKVGIVKPRNTLITHQQPDAVMAVVRGYVVSQNGVLIEGMYDETDAVLGDVPLYQQRNWDLAFTTYEYIRQRDGLMMLSNGATAESKQLHVPGRMDIVTKNGKTIILDGAHNEQKMSTFLQSFVKLFPGKKFSLLIALKQGKELEQLAPLLAPYVTSATVTSLVGVQDTVIRSIETSAVADAFLGQGARDVVVEESVEEALKRVLDSDEEIVVVTGSLYLVAAVRALV